MDSDSSGSQPTQLLQHALAPAQQSPEHTDLASPSDNSNDFSLDSRIIPAQPVSPRYHLQASLLQSPESSGGRVLVEDSPKEQRQEYGEQNRILVTSPAPSDDVRVQGSGSVFFHQHESNSLSASAGKVIGTRSVSFQSPSTTAEIHSLSRPAKSVPVGNMHYRRSPSFPSQDSFGGPVSQDPAEQYLASTKQFDVPLSDLGETATQEVIHSPTDTDVALPDASEHKEFLEAAMREYEAQRATRATLNRRTNVLVAATPSNSGESLGASQPRDNDFLPHNRSSAFAGHESGFEFGGSSSFDKMLDRDLADAPDPTPEFTQPKEIEAAQVDGVVDVQLPDGDDILTTPPRSSKQRSPSFEWIGPAPAAAVTSSDPRSLLRMVHPSNRYRIARMRNLAGNVEPPSCIATGAATQLSRIEETQSCHIDESTCWSALPQSRPAPRQTKAANSCPAGRQPRRENEGDEPPDALDIVPDSEPLRAESSAQTPSHRAVTQSPLKKLFHPMSSMSVHGSGDLVPDSLEVEESEADVPLVIKLASGNTKKSVAPTEDMTVHDIKTRTAVPEKAPLLALGKQPQRPTSSSTKGRTLRVKPPKTEHTEVPTSLPEQDLQGQVSSRELPATTPDALPSKKGRRGLQPLGLSRARHASVTTKPIVSKKRFHNSGTESSEGSSRHPTDDEGALHPTGRVQKEEEEEEEEEESADVDSLPSPPSKPNTSRKKKRRIEDVNPTRGVSKASASTRNKRSETPAVATRSVKRLRSGVSSTRGLTAELATRVFALWKQDGHYYSGVVYSRGLKNKHLVKFDDGTEDEVELKNMRRRELLVGDRVIIVQDNDKGVVSDVTRADSHGSFKVGVDDGEAVATVQVGFRDIRIANRTIQSHWKERMVVAEDIVTVVKPKPHIDMTPSKQLVISTTSDKAQRELVKTGFVVTINPKNEDPTQTKDEAMRAIKQLGGLVIEDWSSVFTMEGQHSQSNKRWIATPQDFRWRSEVNLDRVFLLSDDAHQKPKFLLALALGIPCLSFDWLIKGAKFSSDWQPFLLPAGYSDTLGARISQFVDLDWGNCTEHVTDIMANRVPIKLFSQKTVLCVGADLVPLPPNRARKNAPEEASRYVPWIILCMGAEKVEAITDAKQVSPGHMQAFDYIIVKERNLLKSVKLGGDVVVGDVNWVKECLVSSRLSVPEVD